jgi:hypothetical protein
MKRFRIRIYSPSNIYFRLFTEAAPKPRAKAAPKKPVKIVSAPLIYLYGNGTSAAFGRTPSIY